MPKVTLKEGIRYIGRDEETGRVIKIVKGESVEVSQAKADQLKRDYADRFTFSSSSSSSSKKSSSKK